MELYLKNNCIEAERRAFVNICKHWDCVTIEDICGQLYEIAFYPRALPCDLGLIPLPFPQNNQPNVPVNQDNRWGNLSHALDFTFFEEWVLLNFSTERAPLHYLHSPESTCTLGRIKSMLMS